jgi:hypothetical protein
VKDPLSRWTNDALRNRRIPAGVRHQLIKDGRFRSRLMRRVSGEPPVVPPTPWLDPELRTFSDTGGTVPVSADGAVVLGWRTADDELLTGSSGASAPQMGTVNGKKAVLTLIPGNAGSGLSGAVSNVSRPAQFDLLYAVTIKDLGYAATEQSVAVMFTSTTPTSVTVLAPRYRRTDDTANSSLESFFGTISVFNQSLGTVTNNFAVPLSSVRMNCGDHTEWRWLRFTAVAGSVRMRCYTGPGSLIGDVTRQTVASDAVLNTGTGATVTFSASSATYGRFYRKPDGLFTDEELAAIFADSDYP